MEILGKTALVTGGAKRVGRAISLALAGKGAHILLHYRGSEKEAQSTASEIKALGGRCSLFQADLEKSSDIIKMLAEIEKKSPGVDILVNSASLYFKTPIESVREEDWDKLIAANLKAPFLLSVEIGRGMSKGSGGKIVNIADWSAFRPYKDFIAYCTSKGGLITMTKALARDFAPKVQANAVAPGPILPPPDMDEAEKAAIAKTTALGRWGKPEDIAGAVTFLIESDFINGAVLVVDGGRSIV
jgi:pteridine reductase